MKINENYFNSLSSLTIIIFFLNEYITFISNYFKNNKMKPLCKTTPIPENVTFNWTLAITLTNEPN